MKPEASSSASRSFVSKKSGVREKERKKGTIACFFALLGPGLITGAADDDPSGIVTYSIAGAQFGLAMLWMALVSFPLMAAVQMMCARIGMVTGRGLTAALREKVPHWVLVIMALALFAANTINIGADLFGMADVGNLMTGMNTPLLVIVFGVVITAATMFFKYNSIAATLKWLAISLFAYVVTAFIVRPNLSQTLRATFVPSWPASHDAWSTVVAILGTTISPYLFFWQSSQEVELEKARGQHTLASRRGADAAELKDRAVDVTTGAFFSNLIMYFIILTAALTLNKSGVHLETSKQAASALAPLAGRFAEALYAIGLIGVGFLAIPTLAGSSAYVFSETFGLRQGLDEKPRRARAFYGIFILSMFFGIALTFTSIKPMDALFLTAVINGILAPFILVGILWVACDEKLMGRQTSSWLARIAVGITTLAMFAAAVGVFL
jgi:NRAMP (natural resistance-associated macrophage protein)-like metal ion transporter